MIEHKLVDRISLGATGIQISPMGIGTWAWGDTWFWQYGKGGKTSAQVALNWTISKGTVPIPRAKNARQAIDNAGGLGWRLADAEVAALDAASARVG